MRLLTSYVQSCDWVRRSVRFVRPALNVVMQNYGDFMVAILQHVFRVSTFRRAWPASVCPHPK
jgi:uncharacterized protein YjfI (DUF2170 family)